MEVPEDIKKEADNMIAQVGKKAVTKDSSQIVISIPKSYDFLKSELIRMSQAEDRSLSNYLVLVLAKHISDNGGKTK